MLWGDNGIITKATKAAFYTEMQGLNEQKDLTTFSSFMTNGVAQTNTQEFIGSKVTSDELKDFSKSLKAEIILVRGGLRLGRKWNTEEMWDGNWEECQDMYADNVIDRLSNQLYYVNGDVANGEKKYIYDATTDIVFKVNDTRIGSYTVHSLEYAQLVIDGILSGSVGCADMEVEPMTSSDGTKCYEPDLNSFSFATDIIYYSPDFTENTTVSVKDYLKDKKPKTKNVNGTIYTFADYNKNSIVQGNVKSKANGIESYWVWIPRYAYKINGTNKADTIFVDMNNNPMNPELYGDTLPEGYTVHPAFTQHGENLRGIWFSKYAASSVSIETVENTDITMPDLSNYDPNTTKLIYYTEDGTETIEENYSTNPQIKIERNSKTYYFYNYDKQIWANIKTTANGINSYWVWIPRYAYYFTSYGEKKTILVDMNNNPLDTSTYGSSLPSGYTVHPAFTQHGENLRGIWFSKYAASPQEISKIENTETTMPDLSNYDANTTKLIYYTEDGTESIEENYSINPKVTIQKNNKTYYFYNYDKQIWANIKTTANGINSYWVWIPRYAYYFTSWGEKKTILVDMNNNPIDTVTYGETLPSEYTVHPAFTQHGENLRGIWFSKYAASPQEVNE